MLSAHIAEAADASEGPSRPEEGTQVIGRKGIFVLTEKGLMRLDMTTINSIQIARHRALLRGRCRAGTPERRWSAPRMNDLSSYRDIFADLEPWSGTTPEGYLVDCMGVLTPASFRADFGVDGHIAARENVQTAWPTLGDGVNGEGWFEAVNWIAAAREARDRFVMITLGACYGAQAVGAYRAMQMINPMPCKLVLVEPEPDNCEWIVRAPARQRHRSRRPLDRASGDQRQDGSCAVSRRLARHRCAELLCDQ